MSRYRPGCGSTCQIREAVLALLDCYAAHRPNFQYYDPHLHFPFASLQKRLVALISVVFFCDTLLCKADTPARKTRTAESHLRYLSNIPRPNTPGPCMG